jgi:hypothetical protein
MYIQYTAVAPEYEIRKVNDGETISWLTPEQYDHLRTMRLISPKFVYKGTFPVNLANVSLGPNNLGGTIQTIVTIPGIDNKFVILAVYVTHHMLKNPEVTMVEATIKGM